MRRLGGSAGESGQAAVEFIVIFALLAALVAGVIASDAGEVSAAGTKDTVCAVLNKCGHDAVVQASDDPIPTGAPAPGGGSEVDSTALREAIVAAARSYIGTPYDMGFGADSCPLASGAIDCECLNRLAYADAGGPSLSYWLGGQIDQGTPTATQQPGDLVFWDMNGDGYYGGDYDHTGIYTGNGMVVNANSPGVGTVEQPVSDMPGVPLYIDVLGPDDGS